MLLMLVLFKCLPTFALDTYSPAIPEIATYFGVLQPAVLATFTSYYIGFSFGILIWGVFSDVYGRKSIIQLGAVLYVISSILCPLSNSLTQLVAARLGQGLGDAACATVAVAVLRDCYSGKELLKIMSSMGSLAMIAPIVAPIIGVGLISFTHQWQYIFHFLTAYGIILLICSWIIPETLNLGDRSIGVFSAFKHYYIHSQNLLFVLFCVASALVCGAALSFIGSAAIIYLKIFHISKWEFVICFAINGMAIILANYTVKKLADLYTPGKLTWISFLSCLLVLVCGYMIIPKYSVLMFLSVMSIATFFMSICGNITGVIAMQNVRESFGAAVSMKNFIAVFCGAIANFIITKFSYARLIENIILLQITFLLMAALIVFLSVKKVEDKATLSKMDIA